MDNNKSLEELNSIKAIANYGVLWCRKNRKEFSIHLKFTEEGCIINIGISTSNITEEEIQSLIDDMLMADELIYLKRLFEDLNEFSITVSKDELNTILTIQNKVEEKFKELGGSLFPETFKG